MSLLDSDSEIYYLALALLHILQKREGFSDTARLALILDKENFDRIIDNCGGMTIAIPTREEVNRALRTLIYYQLRFLKNYPMDQALEESGVSMVDAAKVKSMGREINRFLRLLNPNIIGDLRSALR